MAEVERLSPWQGLEVALPVHPIPHKSKRALRARCHMRGAALLL